MYPVLVYLYTNSIFDTYSTWKLSFAQNLHTTRGCQGMGGKTPPIFIRYPKFHIWMNRNFSIRYPILLSLYLVTQSVVPGYIQQLVEFSWTAVAMLG